MRVEEMLQEAASPLESAKHSGEGVLLKKAVLGYFAGAVAFTLFIMIVNPFVIGIWSLIGIFAVALFSNFLFSGIINLFVEIIGGKGDAFRLFCATGLGDFIWGILVPLAFWVKAGVITAFSAFFMAVVLVMWFRARAIRTLYGISGFKALATLSFNYFLLPFAALLFVFYTAALAIFILF